MRKLLLALPFGAVLLAAGVLFGDLGRSLANTELPDSTVANSRTAPATTPEAAADDWTETSRKPAVVKSNFQRPTETYAPGSRRTPPANSKRTR